MGEWAHYAVTYNGAFERGSRELEIYLNGERIGHRVADPMSRYETHQGIYIGRAATSSYTFEGQIVVDSDEAYDRAVEYMYLVMPKQKSALTRYVERRPIFHHYRIEDQLALKNPTRSILVVVASPFNQRPDHIPDIHAQQSIDPTP